jgi:streptogramin lyase
VFVTDRRNKRVTLIDEKGAKRRGPRPTVGAGMVDAAAGLGAVWVVVNREHALFKLDPASGRRLARIALPLAPQTVAVGPAAVWVGMFTETREVPDVLARIDPRTRRVTGTFPMAEGIRSLAASPTAVWVVHRTAPAISRFDPSTEKLTRRVPFGNSRLGDAAYGAGAVWVTSPLEDTVVRITDKNGKRVSSGVGRRPNGIAASGKEVWVTSYIDHTIRRLDPKTGRRRGRDIAVPLNPYVLTITHDSVWVGSVGSGVVAQVRYAATR